MALIRTESFDHFTSGTDLVNKCSTSHVQDTVATAAARTGSNGLRLGTNSSGAMFFCGFLICRQSSTAFVVSGTMTAGVAFRVSALPTGTNKMILMQFHDTAWSQPGVSVFLNSSGTLHFLNNAGSTQTAEAGAGYTGPTIAINTWYYLELKSKYTASTAAGDVQMHVNGTLANEMATGKDVKDGSGGYAYLGLGDAAGGATGVNLANVDFDDLYVLDATGSTNTGFLGVCSVECLYPAGAGASAQWTPDSGSNFARANETTEDGDTSYVHTASVNNRDSYTLGSLAEVPLSVFGVQVTAINRTDAAEANRTLLASVRYGGTYSDGITSVAQAGSYNVIRGVFDTDPAAAAWTPTSINAMEAGVKLVS